MSFIIISSWANIMFQDGVSPSMEQLVFFHNHSLIVIILIIVIVGYNLFFSSFNLILFTDFIESHNLELFWTLSPGIVLMFLGFPSIRILYLMDEVYKPCLTFKSVAHQWYWSYEYSDFFSKDFDSYMLLDEDLSGLGLRLLEVDNRLIVPFSTQVRNLITSADVLHSWSLPSLGLKMDAIPGRLNQTSFFSYYVGLFYGQCSEICGSNHSFMPICLEVSSLDYFSSWISS